MFGFKRPQSVFQFFVVFTLFATVAPIEAAKEPDALWNSTLKQQFFGERVIDENRPLISIEAPKRAANPALVPIRISSRIKQTDERFVERVYLFIDQNPVPLAAKFTFSPDSGRADLSLRIRVNEYSKVRAVAEINDGSLSMASRFVKATGGCSAPVGSDIDRAMARMGKMKLFPRGELKVGEALFSQLMISHPNITGLQMDQLTMLFAPAHFVKKIDIAFNGKPVLSAETDISISEDPSIGFYFVPSENGKLSVEVEDTKGNRFTKSRDIILPPRRES